MPRCRALSLRPQPLRAGALVSVVITCYNYAEYLPAAAASALAQEGVRVEVIIVDDASTDSSLLMARVIAARDGRVSVIVNPVNLGAPAAFNVGLDAARGEYLVRLDADDVLTPGALARGVAVMQALPEVGLVYGRPLHFSGAELPAFRSAATSWTVWRGREWLAARCRDATNVITSPEAVVRRSVLTDIGGMRQLAHAHDMELWLRIAAYSDVAYIRGADQAWHREHAASLSRGAASPLVILREHRSAFAELFGGLAADSGVPDDLARASARGVAREAVRQMRRLLDRGAEPGALHELRVFALEADPSITSTAAWRSLSRRASFGGGPVTARLVGLPWRLARRLATELRERRWRRSGCYERLRLFSMGDNLRGARAVLALRSGAESLQ